MLSAAVCSVMLEYDVIYGVIQEEGSVVLEVTVPLVVRGKSVRERVSNSEWLPTGSCLKLQIKNLVKRNK
jgi:hypothetical protein